MQPFFFYFGGKWKLAKSYGPPRHKHVIEPFAGAAGYSLFFEPKQVTLVEQDAAIAGIWDYLIHASSRDILALPGDVYSLDDLPRSICQGARDLISYSFDIDAKPRSRRGNWSAQPSRRDNFWGEAKKHRIAAQVEQIRHWKIIHGSYEQLRNVEAHWFIDPPYQSTGKAYNHFQIDYPRLAQWCRARKGFVQVCEAGDADWLPFKPLYAGLVKTHGRIGYKGRKPRQVRGELLFQQGEDPVTL